MRPKTEMDITISPETKGEVSPPLIRFVEAVMEGEQLGNWDVHIWACRGEGICNDDDSVICVGLCESDRGTGLLFLHEVAHIYAGSIDWNDSYWHKDVWSKEYDRLCRKYLKVEGVKDLFH